MSTDEAYLDVTENKNPEQIKPSRFARLIQHAIWEERIHSFSGCLLYVLAKMASDQQKPRGLTVVLPEDAEDSEPDDIANFTGVERRQWSGCMR